MTTAALRAACQRFWQGRIGRRLRREALPGLLFALPVFFAQHFLQSLGGAALWYPREWRTFVAVLSTAVGLACFNWARLRMHKRGGDKHAHELRLQARTLRWYAAVVVLACTYQFVRSAAVHSWTPSRAYLENQQILEHGTEGLEHFIDIVKVSGNESDTGPMYRGTVLVPLRWTRDADGNCWTDYYRRLHPGSDPVDMALADGEQDLFVRIGAEHVWLPATVSLVLLLHVAILACAGAGFGSSFSVSESVAESLA